VGRVKFAVKEIKLTKNTGTSMGEGETVKIMQERIYGLAANAPIKN
jgi:hypothetical protein